MTRTLVKNFNITLEHRYAYFSDSDDDELHDDEGEEWIDEDTLSSSKRAKRSFKPRGMEQYLDLLPNVRSCSQIQRRLHLNAKEESLRSVEIANR
mgnify:FL=1